MQRKGQSLKSASVVVDLEVGDRSRIQALLYVYQKHLFRLGKKEAWMRPHFEDESGWWPCHGIHAKVNNSHALSPLSDATIARQKELQFSFMQERNQNSECETSWLDQMQMSNSEDQLADSHTRVQPERPMW